MFYSPSPPCVSKHSFIEDKVECKGHIKTHNITLFKSGWKKAILVAFEGFICVLAKILFINV